MLKWINKKRNQKGFTLIELVVVIAILGILAAIAIPRFGGFTEKAKLAGDLQYGALLGNASVMYFAVNPEKTTVKIDTLVEEDLIEEVTLKSKDYKGNDDKIKINVADKDIAEVKDSDGNVTQAAVKKGDITVTFNNQTKDIVVYPVAK